MNELDAMVTRVPNETAEIVQQGGTLTRAQDSRGFITAVAVQKPRALAQVEKMSLVEARLLGDGAYYGWGAGKDKIEGPTIGLAESIARNWGNCAVDALPVQDLGDSWIFTAAFIDLETGFTVTRQFRQSKASRVFGKHDEERKADIRFQIGQSKATRNVILNALPKWLVNRAVAEAKRGVRQQIEEYIKTNSIESARKYLIDGLAKETVTLDRILARMDRETEAALTIDDLVMLRGDLAALQAGQERADSLFPPVDGPEKSGAELRAEMSKSLDEVIPEPKPTPAKKAKAEVKSTPSYEAITLRMTIENYLTQLSPEQVKAAFAKASITDGTRMQSMDVPALKGLLELVKPAQ